MSIAAAIGIFSFLFPGNGVTLHLLWRPSLNLLVAGCW